MPKKAAAMDYTLKKTPERKAAAVTLRRSIIPPRPGKGQRQPRPYSTAELDGLWATAHRHDWQAMVTLNPPPVGRITTEPKLRDTLGKLKVTLTNWRRRGAFPACIVVTEFDRTEGGEIVANFHVGLLRLLTKEQQMTFSAYWLDLHGLSDNRGRAFQYDAQGGGQKLQDYLAKDISWRGWQANYVKYPAPWLPERIGGCLWFAVGVKRAPSREGARMRANAGIRRRRFDSEHGKTPAGDLTVSTDTHDSEHALAYITPDIAGLTVAKAAPSEVAKQTSEARQVCPVCWSRWGRSLWAGSCKCNPAFPNC